MELTIDRFGDLLALIEELSYHIAQNEGLHEETIGLLERSDAFMGWMLQNGIDHYGLNGVVQQLTQDRAACFG